MSAPRWGGARLLRPILASPPALKLVMKAMLLVEFFARMRMSPVSRFVWKSLGSTLASSPAARAASWGVAPAMVGSWKTISL